jgi:scytalone dehydratase
MQIDYRSFLDKLWEAMPAAEFIAMISDKAVLGDKRLKTQHFIGGTCWEKILDDEIVGWHQLRVPHQRYKDDALTEVEVKGHAHSTNQHWYKKVDGQWKFAGLAPDIRWTEYNFDKVFAGGRDSFGAEKHEAYAELATPETRDETAGKEAYGELFDKESQRVFTDTKTHNELTVKEVE